MLSRLVACLMLALGAGAGCCHAPFYASDRLYEGGPGGPSGSCASGACGESCGAPGVACGGSSLFGCQDGCAEWYLDEWLSDPPKGCDPCDDCGNYVGHAPGHHVGGLLHKLWGYRYTPSGMSPYSNYHGYAHAAHSATHSAAYAGEYESEITDGYSEAIIEGQAPAAIARSGQIDSSYYDIEPGETLVPGSVRVTEGGVIGEGRAIGKPTPAPLPSPTKANAAPNVLPGPAASRPKSSSPAARPVIHRQTGYPAPRKSLARSPRSRPLGE